MADGAVDVRALVEQLSVEELIGTADAYYLENESAMDHWLSKPFSDVAEATDTMITLGHIFSGLDLAPGMRVLEFGAGSGWASRWLSQLGCEVIVCDVSPRALEIAQQLYALHPVFGDQPAPEFLLYDGYTFDLPDGSVDRILCYGSLHHTVNPETVIAEMGRILRPGGRAAFGEPGANHSRDPKSQYEMKNYTVIENDLRMRDIERWSSRAGFGPVELSVFSTAPFHVGIDDYERILAGRTVGHRFLYSRRTFLRRRRIFFLRKAGVERVDSRSVGGLGATIAIEPAATTVRVGSPIEVTYHLENTGTAEWLPAGARIGQVHLGVHLYDADLNLVDLDHRRIPLDRPGGVPSGGTVSGSSAIDLPGPGQWVLEFDLVADRVSWFEMVGSSPARVQVTVTVT